MLCLKPGNLSSKLIDLVTCIRRQTLDLLLQALNLTLKSLNLHLKGLLGLLSFAPCILQLSFKFRDALFELLALSTLVIEIFLQLTLSALQLSFKTLYFYFKSLATLFRLSELVLQLLNCLLSITKLLLQITECAL